MKLQGSLRGKHKFGAMALAGAVSLGALAVAASLAFAQPPAPAAQQGRFGDPALLNVGAAQTWADKPADISFRPVSFYSEGVRLQGQVIYLSANEGKRLPTVVSATGWGGQANSFRGVAVQMARAGYGVFLFDYRGWGGSDGRVILTGASRPAGVAAGATFNGEVQELRTYVDPWEQTTDWFNAISYVSAQPWVDPARIGIRGASFSGGHVVYVAAHDPRVKAVASMIGAFDGRPESWVVDAGTPAEVRAMRNRLDERLATGDRTAFPTPGQGTFSRLRGSVPGNKLSRWNAADSAYLVTTPVLFVLAAEEELYNNREHGIRACNEVKGPRKMLLVPNTTHYDIYGIEGDLAIKASIDWFDKYLRPEGPTRAVRERVTLPAEPERGACNAPFVRTPGTARGPGQPAGYRGPPQQPAAPRGGR